MSSYDQVRYPASVHPQTHVDRLATIGHLRGMRPADIQKGCRILEVGCGPGANLIAMAAQLPNSAFVGVDLAESAICNAVGFAGRLGLENVRFECIDVAALQQRRLEPFDYIIAHGLFSWVPPEIGTAILALCGRCLAPQGIAYVSYHTYPGNHLRDLARGIMRYHAAQFADPAAQIREARRIIHFLSSARQDETPYTRALAAERDRIDEYRDEVFYHDDLSAVNRSYYFYEFVKEALSFGLRYLGEASPNELGSQNYTPEALAKLDELSDEVVREQYKDFVLGRSFRETLLCRVEVELSSAFRPDQAKTLHVGCPAHPVARDTLAEFRFKHPEGGELATNHRLVGRALTDASARWPEFVPFTALLDACHREADPAPEAANDKMGNLEEEQLAEALLMAYIAGFIELRTKLPAVVRQVTSHPRTSALARLQTAIGFPAVTNQLHRPWNVSDPWIRQLIQWADGSRTHGELVTLACEAMRSGSLRIADELEEKGSSCSHLQISERVEAALADLASAGFLTA